MGAYSIPGLNDQQMPQLGPQRPVMPRYQPGFWNRLGSAVLSPQTMGAISPEHEQAMRAQGLGVDDSRLGAVERMPGAVGGIARIVGAFRGQRD